MLGTSVAKLLTQHGGSGRCEQQAQGCIAGGAGGIVRGAKQKQKKKAKKAEAAKATRKEKVAAR